MARVVFENVVKRFGDNLVVKDLNLTVEDHEFLVLVGPSGCGKSTALRMISGLETVTSGKIFIGDRDVTRVAAKNRNVAMVFQSYALYPHMNVYKNMAFALKIAKVPKNEIDQRVRETAEMLELTDLLFRTPREMSGGQRQRVALGRAIVRNPAVFLMDEPLSNLDAKLRVHMRMELGQLHQRLKTTTFYVTHDQVEAMTMGDRIAIIDKGILQQVATPMELYNKPINAFVATFIGSPSMNLFDGIIEDSGTGPTFCFKDLRFPIAPAAAAGLTQGREVVMGIRPEHIVLDAPETSSPGAFVADVRVLEPMGNELTAYLSLEGKNIVAKLPGGADLTVGEKARFRLDLDLIHLFDGETKVAIR